MRSILIIALASLAVACSEDDGPSLDLEATYVLSTRNGQPIPFRASCGSYMVESGRIILGTRRAASYELQYRDDQTDAVYTYTSTGVYNQVGSEVHLTVTGRWSHHTQSYTSRYDFEVIENGSALALHGVGSECDADDTEIYRRMEPLQ
jgi:hypothetical protein